MKKVFETIVVVQLNGFECGSLCFAKGIELLNGNDASTVEFASAQNSMSYSNNINHTKNGTISKSYI